MVSDHLASTVAFLNPVQERLGLVEARMRSQADGNHPDLVSAMSQLIEAGGKRIRPTVTLLTGDMLGADADNLITLAAAIELLHTATLVHDDLIDGSLLRRGMTTLNAEWSPAATVLTGDFVFARAAKLAAETDSVPVMQMFAETLTVMVNGEITQLFRSKGVVSRENYYQRIYSKTASMFELATGSASLLSGVDNEMISAARQFGYEIGMAFQIVDDVLDFTGEQATVGKPVANDLRQGLVTLPAIYFFEANPDDSKLQAVLRGDVYDDEGMDELVRAIRESGAIDEAMNEAWEFILRGLEALSKLPDSTERIALDDLARYIVRRKI